MKKHLALFALLGCANVSAQSPTATVTGQVTEPGGAAVPGAKVVARNPATNISHEGVANDQGLYTIRLLPPGEYQVRVEPQGFNKEIRNGLTLQIGDVARFDFSLQVGEARQTVEVRATAPLTQTENASVGETLSFRQPKTPREGFIDLHQIRPDNRAHTFSFEPKLFNLFNHPNFGAPSVTVNSPASGTISSANAPRDIQLLSSFCSECR